MLSLFRSGVFGYGCVRHEIDIVGGILRRAVHRMGYDISSVVGGKIGLLQIGRCRHLGHEQRCIVSKVLDDPCIPLVDESIEGRNILSLDCLFICLAQLEGQAHAINRGLLLRGISSGQRNSRQKAYQKYDCLHMQWFCSGIINTLGSV